MDPNAQMYAAVDIGTVTCRLLLAEVSPTGALRELERECTITNLGLGVDKTGVLQEDAIERVVNTVAGYVTIVNAHRNEQNPQIPIVAVATSAARDAQNASVLVEHLAALGVTLSVIEGTREAGLSFRGASRGYEDEALMVVDIGGGSTEIVLGTGGEMPAFAHSFNVGCRRMTERFLASNPPTDQECSDARAWVRELFNPVFNQARSQGLSIGRIVAVAGTATSVVSIDKHMEVYDSSRVDGTVVPRSTLQRIYDELRAMTLDARKQVVGLEPARASVIVAGMAILLEVLDQAGHDSFTVSESDILQGIILDAARQ